MRAISWHICKQNVRFWNVVETGPGGATDVVHYIFRHSDGAFLEMLTSYVDSKHIEAHIEAVAPSLAVFDLRSPIFKRNGQPDVWHSPNIPCGTCCRTEDIGDSPVAIILGNLHLSQMQSFDFATGRSKRV